MEKTFKKSLEIIYQLTKKETYQIFKTEDIESSIIEATHMINGYRDNPYEYQEKLPTRLDMSREEMIECSILLWEQVCEALIFGLTQNK
jgi:hypothetical protein